MTFRDLPIQRKVIAVIMLTSVIVLLLTTAAFSIYDLVSYSTLAGSRQVATAQQVSEGLVHSLERDSPAEATSLLRTLQANPEIARAAVYDRRGHLFARYPAEETIRSFPLIPGASAQEWKGSKLTLFMPIISRGYPVGTLHIESRVRSVASRLVSYGEISLLILVGSGLVAFFISRSLQRHISGPILSLANTAKIISEHGDLSVRQTHSSADEIGILTRAFNEMLQRLEDAERAHSFLAAIVESSDAAIVGKDLQGRVVSWNSGAERLFGYTAAEMLGNPISRLLAPDRPDEETQILDRARHGEVCSFETVRLRKDGQQLDIALIISPIRDRLGKVIGISSMMRDISDKKHADQQILKLNAELEARVQARTAELTAANRELEAFTYSVAHDLRAPLRHIEAFSKILQEEAATELSEEASTYLASIRQGSRNMAQLVDDLLNLARIGRQELQRQLCPLRPLVEEVITELTRESPGRHIEWRIRTLPTIDCDNRLMKQVLANLLSNAVKYTRPQPHAIIEIGALDNDRSWTIYVRDNGVGFNMKYISKLFGVFQRLHRSEEFEGTGVGLAIVERIVRKHGGCVWAEAAPGKGAAFYFSLPQEQRNSGQASRPVDEEVVPAIAATDRSPVTASPPLPCVR